MYACLQERVHLDDVRVELVKAPRNSISLTIDNLNVCGVTIMQLMNTVIRASRTGRGTSRQHIRYRHPRHCPRLQ